ncbi:hypothetical protein [Microcella alkaliphila]|uniref:Tetratricopeptide repeat protein n=1 Tax=Microcella alkaliphila TaxID=279828 RepID=A0A0U5BM80_9MICO|nr:hypothetical protein [Microcella alkaliphila]BAU31660.1 uncharacterized protein MalAC0309_0793 [Microcella alkaliphila]
MGTSYPRTAEEAWAEADAYLKGADRPDGLDESALKALSPEARMRVISVLAQAAEPTKPHERVLFEVHQLMFEGNATFGKVTAELESMSPEGRQYARHLLTSHPEYRLKGLSWPDKPLQLNDFHSPAAGNRPSGYQSAVDTMIGVTEPRLAKAIALIYDSKVEAGRHDWAAAEKKITEAIELLDELPNKIPEPMLAVALFHREAYLGQQGDSFGARSSIERSIRIFALLCEADDSYAPDLAAASQSYSYCLAELGELVGARAAINAAIDVLSDHVDRAKSSKVVPLASAYETRCEIEIRIGDLAAARDSRLAALQQLARISPEELAHNPALVEHLEATLERKASRIG